MPRSNLQRPLAMFEKCQKRRSPPHSITARHSGSRGKHRNRVTTWSYTSTDLPDGQISNLSVQSHLQKYFAFGVGQIISTTRAVLSHRGALRNVTKRGAGCGGRGCAFGRRALRRTEKSCGPDTPTLVSSLRMQVRRRRWQESPVAGESAKEAVKTIAWGMPGDSGVT